MRSRGYRVALQLIVGLSAAGGLVYMLVRMGGAPLSLGAFVLFALLSLLVKRSGFHAVPQVTHSLVGMIDVAVILIFGPLAGALVSSTSGFAYLFLRSLRREGRSWDSLLLYPLFDGGLKAWMAWAAGTAYLAAGGNSPLVSPAISDTVPLVILFVLWFALDHLGWSVLIATEQGLRGLLAFLRRVLPVSLPVELLPLPISILVASLYANAAWGLFGLSAAGLLAASLVVQRFSDAQQASDKRLAELVLLDRIGWDFARASLSIDEVAELLYRYCSEIVDVSESFTLGLIDEPRGVVRELIWIQAGQRLPYRELPITPGIRWLKHERRPLLVHDMERETLPFEPTVIGKPMRSVILLPLVAGENLIGVISVQHEEPDRFSADDLRILSTLTAQGALALQKASTYEAEQQRTRQLEAIGRVMQQVGVLRELETVFIVAVDVIRQTFGYYHVALYTLDPKTNQLEFQASSCRSGEICHFDAALGEGMVGWVAKTGDPLLANDVRQEPRYQPVDVLPDTKSELAVPLVAEGKVAGVLDVQSEKLHAFAEADLATMQTVATQVAVAIHEARLYDKERMRARQLAAVREVGRRIVSILDLDELLSQVVQLVAKSFGHPHVHIFTVDRERSEVACRAGCRDGELWNADLKFGLGDTGIIPWVARNGEPLLVNDVAAEPRYRSEPSLGDIRSELSLPLKFGGDVLGVFDLQSERAGTFDEDDLPAFRALSDQIAVAMRNAVLFAAQQEEAWVSTVLLQVAEALGQQTSTDEVLSTIMRLVPLLVGVERCSVFLLNADTQEFVAGGPYGIPMRGSAAPREVRLRPGDVPLLAQLVNSKAAVIVPDEELESVVPSEFVQSFGIRHLAAWPMTARGDVIGCMMVEFSDSAWPADTKPVSILTGIAHETATAVENAQLYNALQEEAWVSTALLQVAESIGSAVDLDEALEAVVRITPILVGVDRCTVFLWDDARREFLPGHQYGVQRELEPEFHQLTFGEGEFPLLDQLREAKEPIYVPDASTGDLVPRALAEHFGLHSLVALPLYTRGDILGAMLVDFAGMAGGLSEKRMSILVGIAGQTAMAVETSRLYAEMVARQRLEQELSVARSIQKSFLPQACPYLPGWQVCALWRSARQVGGDFYDIILLDNDRVGFVIADVSDKGVPAALYMALSKTLLRASITQTSSPASVLQRANDLLVVDSTSGMFVTVFFGILDMREGRFTYANAGHNPPILARPGGTQTLLRADGMILGVMEGIHLEEKSVVMDPGDVLLLYTDGVTDAINEREEEFGMERLAAAVREHIEETADDLVSEIDAELTAHVNDQPQFDDFTLLALKRVGGEGE